MIKRLLVFFKNYIWFCGKGVSLDPTENITEHDVQRMAARTYRKKLVPSNWCVQISISCGTKKKSGSKTISETLIALTLIMYYTKNYKHTQKKPTNQLNKQTKQNKTPNKTNEQMRNKPHKKEKLK